MPVPCLSSHAASVVLPFVHCALSFALSFVSEDVLIRFCSAITDIIPANGLASGKKKSVFKGGGFDEVECVCKLEFFGNESNQVDVEA